jgi:hypothetical protein
MHEVEIDVEEVGTHGRAVSRIPERNDVRVPDFLE